MLSHGPALRVVVCSGRLRYVTDRALGLLGGILAAHPVAPTRPKRVRDAVSTERRILDTAEELFARRGLDAVTTKEIAAGAGVAIGAMYHHFASKDAIYAAVVKRAFGG